MTVLTISNKLLREDLLLPKVSASLVVKTSQEGSRNVLEAACIVVNQEAERLGKADGDPRETCTSVTSKGGSIHNLWGPKCSRIASPSGGLNTQT